MPIYKSIENVYDNPLKEHLPFRPEVIVTEDSNSGHAYFEILAKEIGVQCVSANGKSNVFNVVNSYKDKDVVVVADAAAFGAEMEKLVAQQLLSPRKLALFLPESFEWLILKSGVVEVDDDMLEHPEQYADSTKYMSWEQYFTDVLKSSANEKDYMKYSKTSLSVFYTQGKGKEAIKSTIKGIDFNS